jgi:hypothetical protein
MIDDATSMAPEDRTCTFPAHVIERAPVNAEQLGGLGDGEKIRRRGYLNWLILLDQSDGAHG